MENAKLVHIFVNVGQVKLNNKEGTELVQSK